MKEKGQTLLEIMIAVGVLGIVIYGLVKGLTLSLKNVQFAKERSLAENYAQEGAEWLTFQKEANWSDFSSHTGSTYCLSDIPDSGWPGSGACGPSDFISGANINFRREFSLVETVADEEIQASVSVSWDSPRGGENITIPLTFTNWD